MNIIQRLLSGIALIVITANGSFAQPDRTPKLEKIWETDTIVAIPESVLADLKNNVLYVSLINGGPWVADGIGGVGKLNADGRKYDSTWITGLNELK